MAPKKKDTPSGQRSIAAFFSAKPAASKSPTIVGKAEKLPKTGGEAGVADAKAAQGTTSCAEASTVGLISAVAFAAAAGLGASSKPVAIPHPTNLSSKGSSIASLGGAADVGKSIKVFWADDAEWYEGTVTAFNGTQHHVVYEDGEEEWLDLDAEQFEWLDTKPSKGGKGKKRKAKVIESEDEDEGGGEESAPDSGSDYQASLMDDESEDESLADERDSDASPAKSGTKTPGQKGAKKRRAPPSPKTAVKRAPPSATPSAPPSGTPAGVAVDSGLGLTPSGAAGAGQRASDEGSTAAAGPGASSAARPPRPPPGTIAKTPAAGSTKTPAPWAAKTPGSAGCTTPAALRSALDGGTPGGGAATPSSALREVMAADAERFSVRDSQRFPFLQPDKIRDSSKRRPSDPGYDCSTLHIPPDWFKANKVSEGQRQWWEFKSHHFDSVLLFKMGKFYEMFEMDAHVGAEVCGLSYMKGEQPHCGFPEAAYHQMAETLARAGRKVVVIEQTETPDQLAVRNEERRRKGLKKENVVRREKVAVLTRGTLTDPEMLGAHPDAVFLMSLAELPLPPSAAAAGTADGPPAEDDGGVVRPRVWLGACAVDVATGQMLVGQWTDDDMRSQLRSVLTALQPAELVLPQGEISGATRKVLLGLLRNPRLNELPPQSRFWEAPRAWQELGSYFAGGEDMPGVLKMMHGSQEEYCAAGTALGGCLSYLQDVLLDKQVMSAGRVELLAEAFGVGAGRGGGEAQGPAYMSLDGAALENLEVLENTEGGLLGTLLAAVDNCVTPAGRRRLRQWLCRPLFRIPDITARQDAVQDLMTLAADAMAQARQLFGGLADLERALARLTAAGAGHGSAREAPHVVLYEDVAKKRVQGFAAVLRGLHRVQEAMQLFSDLGPELRSTLLRELTTPGAAFPDMEAALRDMREATDWEEAESSGRVVPREGVDEAFDEAEGAIAVAEANLAEYLQEARGAVRGCAGREVTYVSLNKDSHVIEVPEGAQVPRDWEPMQSKKGVRRYTSEDLRQLVKAREEAFDQRERAMSGILQGLTRLFSERKEVWAAAVDCTAQLDALMSLAVAASCSGGAMCRPNLVPWKEGDAGSPIFRARGLCHPAGVPGSGGVFVPNDVQLGGDAEPFVVLTGPNMGGKSTLLRQVCLACVLAQVGAWVPADSLDLSPVDSVYVRMGARDRIMLGQSTFFVELAETSAALNRATPRSLVALDELGRGTATSDGAAIAAAVLDYLAKEVKCRGLFATHYHRLSDSHASDPDVALKHMACHVTPSADGGVDEVTFLYKLVAGACPKSYGVNVARLAGLPDCVVHRAAQVAEELEQHKGLGTATSADQGEARAVEPMQTEEEGGRDAARGAELVRRLLAAAENLMKGAEEGGALQEVLQLQGEAREKLGKVQL